MALDLTAAHFNPSDDSEIIVSGTADGNVDITVTDVENGSGVGVVWTYPLGGSGNLPFSKPVSGMNPDHDHVIVATRGSGGGQKTDFLRLKAKISNDWQATLTTSAGSTSGKRKVEVTGTPRTETVSGTTVGYRGYVRVELLLVKPGSGGDPDPTDKSVQSAICRPKPTNPNVGSWSCEFDDLDQDQDFVVRLSDVAWVWWGKNGNTGH